MRKHKIIGGLLGAVLLLNSFSITGFAADEETNGTGTTYYIDSDGGNDENSGTSPEEAWSSLEKINETTFQPGDEILFEKGDVWAGQLSPKGSGEKGNPIVIASYGESDARPLIQGNNWCGENGDDLENRIFNAAVYFYNQQYWEITSLEITNRIPGENPDDHIKKYGVLIMGEDSGTLEHMYCRDLYVHDVVSHPIGQQAGIGRGGIIYSIRGNQVPTNWNDIVVEDNIVGPNINHYGINFLSTWGSSQFETETGIPDSEYAGYRYNSTNLVIRNNYCEDIGNAAICPSAYANALIEYNVCDGCNSGPNGNVPIWWENGDYTVAQYNEVFNSGASESKEDSQAFDADVNSKLNYIQYNYTHDNPSGAYFECALGTDYTTHIRYNISQNDGYGKNSHDGGAIVTLGGYSTVPNGKMYVYNNDFYLSEGHDSYITNNWDGMPVNPENYVFANNVIYSDAESKGWHEHFQGTAYNNAYGGNDQNILRTDDEKAVQVTEKDFQGYGTGATGFESTEGYKLSENSVLKNAGCVIPNNGGRDYWGNPVSTVGVPSIGCDNSGTVVEQEGGTIDFEDRAEELQELTGTYQGCEFVEGWVTRSNGEGKILSMSNETESNRIILPAGKKLKGFKAKADGVAWLTITANEYEKSYGLTSDMQSYETGFTSAAEEVAVTVLAPNGSSGVELDDLVLEDAEYERPNLALNKEVQTNGYDQYPGSYANDGDESTMWIHEGADLNEWWIVDLGKDYDLSDFELVFETDTVDGTWKYQIEGWNSTQEDFDQIPLWNANENENGSRVQTGVFEPGSVYRYIRVKITGFPGDDYWPAFAEFRVYEREQSELDRSELTNKIVEAKYLWRENADEAAGQALKAAIGEAKTRYNQLQTKEEVVQEVEKLQISIDNYKAATKIYIVE